jgi:hypothetical protein
MRRPHELRCRIVIAGSDAGQQLATKGNGWRLDMQEQDPEIINGVSLKSGVKAAGCMTQIPASISLL